MLPLLTSFYPPLTSRTPLPFYHAPATLILSILPFLSSNKTLTATLTFPLLLYLCLSWPCYTTGDPSNDYYNGSQFIAVPLWYLDFVFLTPRDGEGAPAFVGERALHKQGGEKRGVPAKYWRDFTTSWERFTWAFRLMLPAQRGIGWNWQVKGIPHDSEGRLSRWEFVGRKTFWAVFFYLQSVVPLTVLGFGVAFREHFRPEQRVDSAVAGAIVGWAGAIWVWDRLNCAYSLAAAFSVAVGMTETWEWPPLMGPLKDAWSVRQMWSATYQQACRRLLSRPSLLLTRLLHIPKGSPLSSPTQLFLTFSISYLFHLAQIFNVTRRDMGEFAFFMSQPCAICVEDVVIWAWRRMGLVGRDRGWERVVGYVWVVAWFSYSLRMYVGGLVEAEVVKDWVWAYGPLGVGAGFGREVLGWLLA
ncbi:hypothetical protein M409DRAFT_23691 [Zasmidium cellare ATCC 36951]|uniref:Wax synthase domain-containing protein n=1 Tax=Zasmidium cellare ATCC 36951 TaxID=1080233 RepID=A0A6A6CH39_ZASCE|nr:uncharacterized protein M409DRAFT_23691 [Zasmidium cellare ATCC 36951]KAF2165963.1 hypothetical protein M409DRAFT_23691 [Zasmidium cellare ATCC 36951]